MQASELILNADGSIYHLQLHPDQLADTIITVGDPNRVAQVSKHFDRVDEIVEKREFHTHTGEVAGQRITVISTGIGTDNIDIVFNELDALANIDFATRQEKEEKRQLTFVRIGTSGALQADLGVDTLLASTSAIGLDGLMHYYYDAPTEQEKSLLSTITQHLRQSTYSLPLPPYLAPASGHLLRHFGKDITKGITLTAAGFYGPQGRELRLSSRFNRQLIDALVRWQGPQGERITNLEMETAGIYGLARSLGHHAISLNALLANRATGAFSEQPKQTVEKLIRWGLERIVSVSRGG